MKRDVNKYDRAMPIVVRGIRNQKSADEIKAQIVRDGAGYKQASIFYCSIVRRLGLLDTIRNREEEMNKRVDYYLEVLQTQKDIDKWGYSPFAALCGVIQSTVDGVTPRQIICCMRKYLEERGLILPTKYKRNRRRKVL